MTINNQKGLVLIECDSCNEVFEGERGEDFGVTWATARGQGWKTHRVGKDWVHACVKCNVQGGRRR
jgi:hypothetical protein